MPLLPAGDADDAALVYMLKRSNGILLNVRWLCRVEEFSSCVITAKRHMHISKPASAPGISLRPKTSLPVFVLTQQSDASYHCLYWATSVLPIQARFASPSQIRLRVSPNIWTLLRISLNYRLIANFALELKAQRILGRPLLALQVLASNVRSYIASHECKIAL